MDPLIALTADETIALTTQRLVVLRDSAVFRIEGPGTTDCLQGLLTNDVKAAGDHGLVWGAVLTPKGMIISDLWVRREGATAATVVVPATAHEAVKSLFQKTLPPRLARCTDQSGVVKVAWCLGGAPEPLDGCDIARPHGPAPFTALLLSHDATGSVERLHAMGWQVGREAFAEASKVLTGWPTLGREIDDHTLVQEVRFDELAGVRYDKGCFTGQETVARLHFRGHPNRVLRGLTWERGRGPLATTVVREGKEVGRVTSFARLGERLLALAVLRREVDIGTVVQAGESNAVVVELPFDADQPRVA